MTRQKIFKNFSQKNSPENILKKIPARTKKPASHGPGTSPAQDRPFQLSSIVVRSPRALTEKMRFRTQAGPVTDQRLGQFT
jgi:hypothetical protein